MHSAQIIYTDNAYIVLREVKGPQEAKDMDSTSNGKTQNFMVIAAVAGDIYLTKVQAESDGGAEHVVLDLDRSVKFGKAIVTSCQAFSVKEIATECFAWMAISAEPIGFGRLKGIIEAESLAAEQEAREQVARLAGLREEMKRLKDEIGRIERLAEVL